MNHGLVLSGDNNLSQLKTCLEAAHNFLLSEEEVRQISGALTDAIEQNWDTVCAKAELNQLDKKLLWKRQFLKPYSIER